MEGIRAALDGLIELTTGRVTEFRRKLVLKNREILYSIVRDLKERTCNALVVVVHALNREVVIARPLPRNGGSGSQTYTAAAGDTSIQEREVNDATTGRG